MGQFEGLTIVAPISTTMRNYPTYHELRSTKIVEGKILLDKTIALDLHARGVETIVESLPKQELQEVLAKYKLLFDMKEE